MYVQYILYVTVAASTMANRFTRHVVKTLINSPHVTVYVHDTSHLQNITKKNLQDLGEILVV